MQIRTRLTLRFTAIVMAILAIFSVWVYIFSMNDQKEEFYSRLRDQALTDARLYSKDTKEIDVRLLKIVDANSLAFFQDEQEIVYDTTGHEVYRSHEGNKGEDLPADFRNKLKNEKEIRYKNGKTNYTAIYYSGTLDKLFVVASAYDNYGEKSLKFLMLVLIFGLLLAGVITAITGYYYSKQALLPISKVINRVEHITASKLDMRVDTGNGTDEIAMLGITFNRMLDRIESAFEMQKNFVSNASHELRTPLTAITGQIEVSLINNREPEEYRNVLSSILDDMKDLNQLANGLLELTQAGLEEGEVKLQPIRIDELLWQAKNELVKRKQGYSASFNIINFPDEEKGLVVYGNQLLKSAILNIMDNACKFSSDHHVHISFHSKDNFIYISFTDKGVGISGEEMDNIFRPFHRAANAKPFSGHGLGLSLTKKIIELHQGSISVESEMNKFTTITITLPVNND